LKYRASGKLAVCRCIEGGLMAIRSVLDADVAGKRVLVRVDFNVPIQNGQITDDTRIKAALPTINELLDNGAAVILVSHLGRPKGRANAAFSLAPVAARLRHLLERPVRLASDVVGSDARSAAKELKPGEVLLLENVRFEAGEETNDPDLSRQLAAFADIFVNDAFGAAHRAHASTVGVTKFLPSSAGLLMLCEIDALRRLVDQPERPFVAILGGAKVSDKIGVVERLLPRVDAVLVGGGMANTFLLAKGIEVGHSLAERDFIDKARDLFSSGQSRNVDIVLPVDVAVAPSIDDVAHVTWVPVSAVPSDQAIFDIGPGTVQRFGDALAGARTIFWNGPMGIFESPTFAAGTKGVAELVAKSDAFTVVGGGDSVAAVEQMGLGDHISHISTGGGASLEFVEGRTLPGLAALDQDDEQSA
jgi:phosphoglycerate kinase